MNAEDFAHAADVSRETLERLERYHSLLLKWQRSINLVAPRSLAAAWERHFLDSAQLAGHAVPGIHVDLGSGGGFPGLVLAIVKPDLETHLVESDQRKSAFLREVARETGTRAVIHAKRLEAADLPPADLMTARALAPLADLLAGVARFLKPGGIALLPKGASWREELAAAEAAWRFRCTPLPSLTDPEGRILRVEGLTHA